MERPVDEMEVDVGQHLRARRIAADLTQAELAAAANVSLGAVRSLEAGRGSNLSTLLKVLRSLGATDWIDHLAPPPKHFSPLEVLAQQQTTTAVRRPGPPRVRRRRAR